jgi:hypothetical protein
MGYYMRPHVLRQKMVECQLTGMTAKEAAAWLGLSVYHVNLRRREFGLPLFERPEQGTTRKEDLWTPDDVALLACCIDAGCSLQQTMGVLGRSYMAVTFKRLRLGLPHFRRARNKPQEARP